MSFQSLWYQSDIQALLHSKRRRVRVQKRLVVALTLELMRIINIIFYKHRVRSVRIVLYR